MGPASFAFRSLADRVSAGRDWGPASPGNPFLVSRTGEKIFGLLAIAAGVVLAILAGIEADIPPVVLLLITLAVIGWVIFYVVLVRPAATGSKRPARGEDQETE